MRLAVFVLPVLASMVFVTVASHTIERPSQRVLVIGWFALLTSGAAGVIWLGDRALRRLLPIVALFNLSLVFPDKAPSRFKLAIRRNTVRQLQRDLVAGSLDSRTPQEAAEHLLALAAALNDHDRLTRGHTERVRAYALMIGEEMGLDDHDLERLHWAGLIHDVGKLEVPAEILQKTTAPDADEWVVLRDHPARGGALVEPLRPWLGEWADAASQHHERWDGSGYPAGLAGEEISLSGRIVAVADAFDVMTSTRSYKSAYSHEYAREELVLNAGSQFDPTVVRAFLNIGLGRLRLIMGPLSWLGQLPVIGQSSVVPAVGTTAAAGAAMAASSVIGLVSTPPPAPPEPAAVVERVAEPTARQAIDLTLTGNEDSGITATLAEVYGAAPVSVEVIESPATGTLTTSADGALVYEPAPDTSGTATARVRICFETGDCVISTITIRVDPVNDRPTTTDDQGHTREDTAVAVDVAANDHDVDDETLSVVAVRAVVGRAGEHLSIVDGVVHYVPAPDMSGPVDVRYVVADDDGLKAEGSLRIDVEPINDAPVAVDDGAATPFDTPLDVAPLSNDIDVDADVMQVVDAVAITGGSVTVSGNNVTFVPAHGFSGPARVDYTIEDPHGARSTATINIFVGGNPRPMRAHSDTSTTTEDRPVAVAVLANDVALDDAIDPTTLEVVSAPSSGSSIVDGETILYTPHADRSGADHLRYRVCDIWGFCSTADVHLAVTAVNDAPTFTPGSPVAVLEDAAAQTLVGWARDISTGAPDEADQVVALTVVADAPSLFFTQPAIDADGTLTFTPAANANGTTTLTITATDDGGTDNGGIDTTTHDTTTITLTAVNDAPTLTVGSDVTAAEDSGPQTLIGWAGDISSGAPDEADQALVVSVVADAPSLFSTQPAIDADGTLTFTPAANANGTTTITITATDDGGTGNGGIDTTTHDTTTITLTAVNDAPTAVDDAASMTEDAVAPLAINVLANDSDLDLDTLSVDSYDDSGLVGGTLTDVGAGSFTYTPFEHFHGTETWTYTVIDGNGGSDSATVTITVTPVADAPVAGDDGFVAAEATAVVVASPGVLGNDSDPDADLLTADPTPVAAPSDGSLSLAADGSFTYTPDPGFVGVDSFTYQVSDGALTDTATVSITVNNGVSAAIHQLDDSGSSASDFDLVASPPPSSDPVFDVDGDGHPGLTFEKSKSHDESDPAKHQLWRLPAGASTLALDGPVVLDLYAAVADFRGTDEIHPYVWLLDCDGATCTEIAAADVHVDPSDPSASGAFVGHQINLGSVTHDVVAGNDLVLRVQFDHSEVWVATTVDYPSALHLTLANVAPTAVDDNLGATEDVTATLTVLGNDTDSNLDPASVTITSPASSGTATPNIDGTIDYLGDPNTNGVDSFDYQVCDSAGLCATATVTVTVGAVNDPPSFTGGPDVTDSVGSHSTPNWATSIAAGPADESGQSLTFVVTANDNPAMFTVVPAVDAGGTLTFTSTVPGTANVTIELRDDGGGDDTSSSYTFTITVT